MKITPTRLKAIEDNLGRAVAIIERSAETLAHLARGKEGAVAGQIDQASGELDRPREDCEAVIHTLSVIRSELAQL